MLKDSDDLVILGPLGSIFFRIPEHHLKDLVTLRSPGECSMIDRFLGDAFGVWSCSFWSTVLQFGARLPIHTLNYRTVRQWCPVSNRGVFEFNIAHRRSVAAVKDQL